VPSRTKELPSMPSCTACGLCCGPATATREEAKRIKRYLKDTGNSWVAPDNTDPLRCGFLRDNQDGTFSCGTYPYRPWVCRAFGVVKQMPCQFFPEDAVVDYPAHEASLHHHIKSTDQFLGEYFEPGYWDRIDAAVKHFQDTGNTPPPRPVNIKDLELRRYLSRSKIVVK
jgi:Fe-S-cluster containining protein